MPHCVVCGERHTGDCSPQAFAYYQCELCDNKVQMPWDAVQMVGLKNCYCRCNAPAEEAWKQITYKEYMEK